MYEDNAPSDSVLAQLSLLASEQQHVEERILEIEKQLEGEKIRLRHLSEVQIPELMDQAGVADFTTREGVKIKVAETIRGSIPLATAGEAMAWLETNGYERLIKRKFLIEFGKDEEGWANKFASDLAKRKRQLKHEVTRAVHPSTLQAFVREQLAEGRDFPMDLFGVYRQRKAKIESK